MFADREVRLGDRSLHGVPRCREAATIPSAPAICRYDRTRSISRGRSVAAEPSTDLRASSITNGSELRRCPRESARHGAPHPRDGAHRSRIRRCRSTTTGPSGEKLSLVRACGQKRERNPLRICRGSSSFRAARAFARPAPARRTPDGLKRALDDYQVLLLDSRGKDAAAASCCRRRSRARGDARGPGRLPDALPRRQHRPRRRVDPPAARRRTRAVERARAELRRILRGAPTCRASGRTARGVHHRAVCRRSSGSADDYYRADLS